MRPDEDGLFAAIGLLPFHGRFFPLHAAFRNQNVAMTVVLVPIR
jgi:hypothetical protein